jgi:hypothetical protein
LQGAIGNRAVNKLLANQPTLQAKPMFGGLSRELVVQPKLTIGAVGDKYEQEADRISKQVVNQINVPATQSSTENQPVQREGMPEEDDQLQRKPIDTIQREGVLDEENELGRQARVQRSATENGGTITPDLESTIQQARGSGQLLSDSVREPMEQAFGADFSGVKIHTDAQASQLNRSIQAKAFTTGQDLFFRQGEYNPGSVTGQELIAHELTHVVQQSGKNRLYQKPIEQRSPQISQFTSGSIQRLISPSGLIAVAGEPKKNKKFFGRTLFRMSQQYKAILSNLDSYREQLRAEYISPDPPTRIKQASTFKQALDTIIQACDSYLDERGDDTERSPHIQKLKTDAGKEQNTIDNVAANPTFANPTFANPNLNVSWRYAVNTTERVQNLEEMGGFDKSLFHGTGSKLLDKFGGELMSGKELENRGILKSTGEGDFFSTGGGGEKDFVSTGEGAPGLGTSLAYAQAAHTDKNYNTALYTDTELIEELKLLDQIVKNYNYDLVQIPKDDKMGADKTIKQFQSLLNKLVAEAKVRRTLPPSHPRRQGKPYSDSTYPLLFEFGMDGLDVRNPRPDIPTKIDTDSPRAMGGERKVFDTIDFRDPARLKRVYCPLEHIAEVREKLIKIVGHDEFETLPIELLETLNKEATQWTKQSTIEVMQAQYENIRRMVLYAYAEGMSQKKPIDNDLLVKVSKELRL